MKQAMGKFIDRIKTTFKVMHHALATQVEYVLGWYRRRFQKPPVIDLGDLIRVRAGGHTYTLRLHNVRTTFNVGTTAEFLSLEHSMQRRVMTR